MKTFKDYCLEQGYDSSDLIMVGVDGLCDMADKYAKQISDSDCIAIEKAILSNLEELKKLEFNDLLDLIHDDLVEILIPAYPDLDSVDSKPIECWTTNWGDIEKVLNKYYKSRI